MKNYDETINTVFERIDEYKLKQARKKKMAVRVALPAFSMCLAVVIGVFVWKGDMLKTKPPVTLDDSTVIGEKDYIEPDEVDGDLQGNGQEAPPNSSIGNTSTTENAVDDWIGSVEVGGVQYIQCSADVSLFTADKYLGDATNFEGSYKQFSDDITRMTTELYTVKESPNVMMIKLGNGGTVILGRAGEIVVDGKTYFSTQWTVDEFTVDRYLGQAKDYELIEVPGRESFIIPEDEIWTVQENGNILLVKQSNGDIIILSVW